MKRISKTLLILLAIVVFVVSLTSCMDNADSYTKDDVTSLITELKGEITMKNAALEEKISTLKSDCEAKISDLKSENKVFIDELDTLTANYHAKVAELEAADKATADAFVKLDNKYRAEVDELKAIDAANTQALAKVEADYKAAVAELEAADKANADAFVELNNKYTVKLNEINATISANTQKITSLESALADEISNVKAEHEEVVAELRGLIAALEETSEDNVKRIAKLEAQIEALLSKHEHIYGEWIDYRGNDAVYCEERLFYRICTECSVLEWKSGTYDNHSFSTTTTPPTCVSMGYDTKTCSICGKIEKINETPISDHIWKDNYSYDNSFHWIDCNYCDAEKEKAEHTTDESGYCTVCDKPVGATEGIIYGISPDGTYASVVGYDGTATRIKIADMYEGVPVTELCDGVFQEKNIVSVIIPNSITSIGAFAFSGCSSLTSVTIGDSVTSIGSYAFSDCTSLTSVTIGDSVTSIRSYAFAYCKSLTSVTIPDSVVSIGSSAFYGCNSALYTEYNYGKYVGDSENPYSVLIGVTNENFTTYDINEETKIIAIDVFYGCERLNSIVIPDSVTSIDDRAFYKCSSLTSVTIGNSVTSIGDYAFNYCDSLTSVTIGDSVTSIGSNAFSNCDITDVYYSGSKEEWEIIVGNDAFASHITIHFDYVKE